MVTIVGEHGIMAHIPCYVVANRKSNRSFSHVKIVICPLSKATAVREFPAFCMSFQCPHFASCFVVIQQENLFSPERSVFVVEK